MLPRLIALISLLMMAFPAVAYRVQIPVNDLLLNAEYHPPAQMNMPAVLLMHGCGGLFTKSGELGSRISRMGGLLQEMGYGVLYLDSFSSRGVRQVCTSRASAFEVTPAMRADDAQVAINWLRKQVRVDGNRIGVLGWSHGADAILELMGRKNRWIRAAVTYYPACRLQMSARSYRVSAPTLVLIGGRDEWTPSQDCKILAAKTGQDLFHVVIYPDALHDFDALGLNTPGQNDIPNRAGGPDSLLMSGPSPEAMHDANRRTFKWFARWFDPARAINGPPPSSID